MTQDHDGPVPVRPLTVVRGSTEPGPVPVPAVLDASTDSGTEPLPVLAAAVPMTAPERAGTAVRHWAGTAAQGAGQMWLHPGRVAHALWHGKPASMAEHRVYVKSRAWVPPEMTGRPAEFVTLAGIAYHLVIARPVKTAARIVDGAADRPLRFVLLLVFVIALILIVSHL